MLTPGATGDARIRRTNWSSHEPCSLPSLSSADQDWNAWVAGEPVEQVAQAVGALLLGVVLSQPAGESRDQRVLRLVDADRSEVRLDVSRRAPDGGTGQGLTDSPVRPCRADGNWRRRP